MNKQELIEEINEIATETPFPNAKIVDHSEVIELIKRLDEPQKVQVPEFVADFIAEQKKLGHTLSYSIDACMSYRVAEWYWDNSELFVRAWIDGYKITEGTKYKVIMKGVSPNSCMLKYYHDTERWIMGASMHFNDARLYHTKRELEAGGFGEVFSSPLFEVEEVAE